MACVELIKSLLKNCDNSNMKGGAKGKVWITQLSLLNATAPFTEELSAEQDGTVIRAINFAQVGSGYNLQVFETKNERNSFGTEIEIGTNFNARNNSSILQLYAFTQGELDAIDQLNDVDDAVVIMQDNNGRIIMIGTEEGAKLSAFTNTSGVLKQDDTVYNMTLTASEKKLPRIFKSAEGSTLAQDIAYLNSLVA
jgi:hypothetical protein